MQALTPKQIVQELDKHIVGQQAAKKAVAIALRNRWRRKQLSAELQQEITPKNILMIGYYKSSFKNHNSKIYITVGRLDLSMIIWSNRRPS